MMMMLIKMMELRMIKFKILVLFITNTKMCLVLNICSNTEILCRGIQHGKFTKNKLYVTRRRLGPFD